MRKVLDLHYYDCLRANKATMAWGLEVRVPFLDRDFLDTAMSLDPMHKLIKPRGGDAALAGRGPDYAALDGRHTIEKAAMRRAFDVDDDAFGVDGSPRPLTRGAPYLPSEVLWRQKEQFSDGVGYSWIDGLKDHADVAVSDAELAAAPIRFPTNPPVTKEAYLVRAHFAAAFGEEGFDGGLAGSVPGGPSIACSTAAAIEWDAAFKSRADQSGRAVAGVHDASYHDAWSTPAAEAKEPPTGVIDAGKAVVKATAAEAATKRERDDAPLASAAP